MVIQTYVFQYMVENSGVKMNGKSFLHLFSSHSKYPLNKRHDSEQEVDREVT